MWIVYDIATGTILEKSTTEPTVNDPTKDKADVNYLFIPGQPVYLLRYNGTDVEANTEENINHFHPTTNAGGVISLNSLDELYLIGAPDLRSTYYIRELDISFQYNGAAWVQCAENVILREGLAIGTIYALDVKIG